MTEPWNFTEAQRRQFREAHIAAKLAKPPSKPWRVTGPNPLHEDYRSQSAAYEAVRELTGFGHAATVHHWENGDWRLYERIEPAGED